MRTPAGTHPAAAIGNCGRKRASPRTRASTRSARDRSRHGVARLRVRAAQVRGREEQPRRGTRGLSGGATRPTARRERSPRRASHLRLMPRCRPAILPRHHGRASRSTAPHWSGSRGSDRRLVAPQQRRPLLADAAFAAAAVEPAKHVSAHSVLRVSDCHTPISGERGGKIPAPFARRVRPGSRGGGVCVRTPRRLVPDSRVRRDSV